MRQSHAIKTWCGYKDASQPHSSKTRFSGRTRCHKFKSITNRSRCGTLNTTEPANHLKFFIYIFVQCVLLLQETYSSFVKLIMADLAKRHPDVDPFLLKKWERVFNAFFDRNASEEVDWGDFYLVTRFVRDIYGADSDQMRYARKNLKSLWEGMLALFDANKDDKIQLDEWINVLKKHSPENEPEWMHNYMSFLFTLFDVSADDKLDLAEYTDGMMAYGFDAEDAHAAFRKFAKDPTGKSLTLVPVEIFKGLWHQYFFSKDKIMPGNDLFGILK